MFNKGYLVPTQSHLLYFVRMANKQIYKSTLWFRAW